MQRLRPQLRWFSRLALGLLLALALVPSLSRALADGAATGPWAEYCSTGGIGTRLAAADGPDSAPAPAAMQSEHCPLCGHGSGPLAPPPALADGVPALDRASLYPPLFAHAPRPLFAWRTAQPRGPPAQA